MPNDIEAGTVLQGTFGALYVNIDGVDTELANVKKFKATAKPVYEEYDNCNIIGKSRVLVGLEIEGEFSLNRLNFDIAKQFLKGANELKLPSMRLVGTLSDPNADEQTRLACTGVTLDEVVLIDFETKKLIEETYNFKAVKAEYTD